VVGFFTGDESRLHYNNVARRDTEHKKKKMTPQTVNNLAV
jgi:hypothetical protein